MASARSTSSAADSRARTSVPPAKARASKAIAPGSGLRCCDSSRKSDPVGLSLRTYLLSACEGLTQCSLEWKPRATPSGRSWWVLGLSGQITKETARGSWLTPRSCMRNVRSDRWRHNLEEAVGRFRYPTPQAQDAKHAAPTEWEKIHRLQSHLHNVVGGIVNPTWVEWLMNYPPGWTDLDASETP